MPTPFLDFIHHIGSNPAALDAFVADPNNDPAAKALTQRQKDALFSAEFSQIAPLLQQENPKLGVGEALAPGAQIGWNMFRVEAEILTARAKKTPGTPVA